MIEMFNSANINEQPAGFRMKMLGILRMNGVIGDEGNKILGSY